MQRIKECDDVPPAFFSLSSHRLRIAFLLMMAVYVFVSMRMNLGMAIVCMVNSTAFADDSRQDLLKQASLDSAVDSLPARGQCARVHRTANQSVDSSQTLGYSGTLLWSPVMQSQLFSASFYGSLMTVLIAGPIADRVGSKNCLTASALVMIACTLAAPTFATWSYAAYFVTRVVMGAAEGFQNPSVGAMSVRWFPQQERSTAVAIYTTGNQIAAIAASVVSAGLCTSSLGWPMIFYIFGVMGIVWLAL